MKRGKTPTFLVELPLSTNEAQAKHLRAHLEAARSLYNALLGEAMKRLRIMRADSRWQEVRRLPKTCKQQRNALFSSLRQQHGFSEFALHDHAKTARCNWIADHIDSTMAQTLATRAYEAANRVCLGQAKKVRFKSKGHGLDSVEGKRNDIGLRFLLQAPQEGNAGHLIWGKDRIRSSNMGWISGSSTPGSFVVVRQVNVLRAQTGKATATTFNWWLKVFLIRKRKTRWVPIPLD